MKMKDSLSFPIWTITYILDGEPLQTPTDVIRTLLCNYMELTNNISDNKTDTDIANEIGKIYIANINAASDLKSLLTEENCRKGMLKYLEEYCDGKLPSLAKQVGDGGQYINELRQKIDAGDANWVWKSQTVDQQIDAVILEYEITVETCNLLGSCTRYRDAIALWNEKCGNMKVAYEAIKQYVSDIQPLLSQLKEIKQNGALAENKKQSFLDLLQGYGAHFNAFYTDQFSVFEQACSFELQELSDSDKEKIFAKMQSGCFTMDTVTYKQKVESLVAEHKKALGSTKLKSLWKEKTGTESPYQWSKQYMMPIQLMIPDHEWPECRPVFGVLNNQNPTDKDIEKALLYLETFDHWGVLNDEKSRKQAFCQKMLGDNAVMISDVEEVQKYLVNHVSDAPYHWMGNNEVMRLIREYAQSKYNTKGYEEAMKKIDSMDAESVKKYLKDLIKNNMSVGIQIIKNN
jgi:hypothetical protein